MATKEELELQFEETVTTLREILVGDDTTDVVLPGGGTVRTMSKIDKDAADSLAAITADFGNLKVDKSSVNESGGVVGLSGYKLIVKNAQGAFPSFLVSAAPAQCTWNLPTQSGNLALVADITSRMGIPDGIATLDNGGQLTAAQTGNLVKTSAVNATGGVVGLSGYKAVLKNAAGTVSSFLASSGSVARNWTMPDADGTVALLADILSRMGAANGLATLDANQLVPASQLPSYVDDVLEYDTKAQLLAVTVPQGGQTKGKIYVVDADESDSGITNQYRWSGTQYIKLVSSPGTTDAVAEGANNKYFTAARAIASVLTGFNSSNVAATAADTIVIAAGKFQGQIDALVTKVASTTTITEGTNLYFTVARVLASVLTGLSTATATKLAATDTMIQALGKLQGQINAIPFDTMFFVGSKPPASGKVIYIKAGRAFTIPANFAGTKVEALTAATASTVWTLTRNGATIGTFTWAAGAVIPTLATNGGVAINIAIDDKLVMTAAATQDNTMADVAVHLLAVLT